MTEFYDAAELGDLASEDPAAVLERVSGAQEALQQQFAELREGFDKLARHLGPLLTRQYEDTLVRMRMLETRIRNRQERPLISRMAELLTAVRRLESGADIKMHVEEALLDALTWAGYEEMGQPGERFDPGWHEAVSGSVGKAGIVTRVHRRGLVCYGEVFRRALVEVEPAPGDGEPGPGPLEPGPGLAAESEQGEIPA